MQLAPYPYFDLKRANIWLFPMLLIAGALAWVGFFHGLSSVWLLQDFSSTQQVASLPPLLLERLQNDNTLQFSQIAITLFLGVYFFFVWLYLAARNINLLHDQRRQSIKNSAAIFSRLVLGILFSLQMMRSMWRSSRAPDSKAAAYQGLVPSWWGVLIGANVLKIYSVYALQQAVTVKEWQLGFGAMLGAYVLYFALYVLTWRLVCAFDYLQSEHWFNQQQLVASSPEGSS